MKKIIIGLIATLSIISNCYAAPLMPNLHDPGTTSPAPSVSASSSGGGGLQMPDIKGIPQTDLGDFINTGIKVLFAIGEVGFVIMLLYGAVTFITSAGNEAAVDRAKKTITYAIIGIVLLFFTWAIVDFVIKTIKSPSTSSNSSLNNSSVLNSSKTSTPSSTNSTKSTSDDLVDPVPGE